MLAEVLAPWKSEYLYNLPITASDLVCAARQTKFELAPLPKYKCATLPTPHLTTAASVSNLAKDQTSSAMTRNSGGKNLDLIQMSRQFSFRVWNSSATRKHQVAKSRSFHRNMVSSTQVLLGGSERSWVESLSKQERETAWLDLPPCPPNAPLWEQLSITHGARLLGAIPAPVSWLGRVLSADKLFQIRLCLGVSEVIATAETPSSSVEEQVVITTYSCGVSKAPRG